MGVLSICVEPAGVMEWSAHYDGPKFHALLSDPPYELGFMGKNWDRSGIAFNPETWAALAEHLHPGAFGMAFASARGWHRLAVAIEDACLRIHPSIFGWATGSGFPKATRIDTQVDAAAGAERESTPSRWAGRRTEGSGPNNGDNCYGQFNVGNETTMAATPLAQAWQGHRYGLQCIKPALEPIIVFQKPYGGKPVDCITETGAGALWIDGSRIGTETIEQGRNNRNTDGGYGKGYRANVVPLAQGRWPANFALQHTPGCVRMGTRRVKSHNPDNKHPQIRGKHGIYNEYAPETPHIGYADPDGLETVAAWDCVPECPVRRLGEQSGERGGDTRATKPTYNAGYWGGAESVESSALYADKGTAARFFYQADWSYEIAERLAMADPVRYVAKASRRERDAGCEALSLQEWTLQGRAGNADMQRGKHKSKDLGRGGTVGGMARNPHPTIKPIALCRWLATLLLPPKEYAPRRLLVPFCGTGSEMIGAALVGWENITGIEMDADTVAIAEARIRYWINKPQQLELGIMEV